MDYTVQSQLIENKVGTISQVEYFQPEERVNIDTCDKNFEPFDCES